MTELDEAALVEIERVATMAQTAHPHSIIGRLCFMTFRDQAAALVAEIRRLRKAELDRRFAAIRWKDDKRIERNDQ